MAPKRKRPLAAATKAGSKDVNKVEALFDAYQKLDKNHEGEDVIGPEAVEKFCADLKLEPSDRKVLLLAWRFGAKRMGYFSRQEFREGFALMNSNSIAQLRKALPSLEAAVQEPSQQQAFYSFAFQFCLTEPGQRIIDTETAAQMLGLALPDGRFVGPLCEYLREQGDYKKITRDQWASFLRFDKEIKSDTSNFDHDSAWPVILDSFVDWYRSRSPPE